MAAFGVTTVDVLVPNVPVDSVEKASELVAQALAANGNGATTPAKQPKKKKAPAAPTKPEAEPVVKPVKKRQFRLLDGKTGVLVSTFSGKTPREAAKKAANRGHTDILLREVGTRDKFFLYEGSIKQLDSAKVITKKEGALTFHVTKEAVVKSKGRKRAEALNLPRVPMKQKKKAAVVVPAAAAIPVTVTAAA